MEGQDEIAIISASGAMKPHGSSLNPYATSYIPISKREANKAFIAESSSRENIGANLPGNSEQKMCGLNLRNGKKAPDDAVASAVKNHPFHGSLSKDNSELAEMETFHTEVNMELELLQICFPGLSEQSLTDVYFANNADLDAAMDMLNQLEDKHPSDFEYDPKSLPDSLDIGDISESGFAAADQLSSRMKNVASGASTSTRF